MAEQERIVYLNGKYLPLSEARVPVLDRGFLLGDGIYEVIPVYRKLPFRQEEHLARLERSLSEVRITNPMERPDWDTVIDTLVARHPEPCQAVYLQVTRGVAPRQHEFPVGAKPTVFGMSLPFTPPSPESIGNGLRAISLPDDRWLRCHIKSISLLGNVLARQSAVESGADEAILFRGDTLTEGAAANIWVVKAGRLLAPVRNHLILEGIRYELLLTLAGRCGIPVEIRDISRAEVESADELLLTAATREVQPITRLDGKPVGNGHPGPVFGQLFAAYQDAKREARSLT